MQVELIVCVWVHVRIIYLDNYMLQMSLKSLAERLNAAPEHENDPFGWKQAITNIIGADERRLSNQCSQNEE